MMDEHQSPTSSKKRKSAVALPSQKRCLIKKTKIAGDLAGTYAALSQSPSKIVFNSSPTSSNQTVRIPSAKNVKAGPSSTPNAASRSRDLTTPTRVSSRISRPTFKKRALSVKRPRSPESDGTPPLSIILPIPSPSLKQKRPRSSTTKRLAGNNIPSERKWLDPNSIELTSSDDGSRPQPPRKRIKHTHKKPFISEVIDLCSESEDVIASPRHKCTRDEGSVIVLSTDEEVDVGFPASTFRKIDTKESPALPPLRDISLPIEIQSVFQASPSPLAHNIPVPKPKASVSEEDGFTDKNNIYAEKINLPRGSLQVLYNEALTRCTREPRREKDIAEQPSPFSSLKCVPARIIRYAAQTQSPSLHTPLFFSRIILRLRARLKQPKTSDSKAFSNPKAFPDATAFSTISNDTGLNSMKVSKLNEDQDTLTYSDAVMEISAVDSEALEIATETILMPPDFQDDTSSDAQVASISPTILVSNMGLNERPVSRSLGSPSPLPNQENPLWPEVTIVGDTPIHSIQAQATNCRPTTPDGANSFAISLNMLCNAPSNSDAVNYHIETPQEAETSLLGRENRVDQVATMEPFVLKDAQSFVQALERIYDISKFYEFPLHPTLEWNDTAKPSAAFEPLSESPTEYAMITNTSSVAISSSVHTSSASKYLPELSLEQEMTLNISSPAVPSSKDVSLGLRCLSESPTGTIPNLYPLASSSSTDTLSSRASSLSTRSHDSCFWALTSGVEAQKQESLICSKPFPSPIDVSFDIDKSELNLQAIMCNMLGDDDDDDDISISGMELVYPEEHTI